MIFPHSCAIAGAGSADFYKWSTLQVVGNSLNHISDEVLVAVVVSELGGLPGNKGTLRVSVLKSSILANVDWFGIRT